ncbi:hypothetical protein ATCC90586_005813 [Pythium insidiosum]|nr:hypothetical protein ATCC90586_005813 [Pythium insidiosum]
MGDDPYDFEIAIPTAQHGGTRATGKSKRDAYGARDSRAFRHEDDDDDEEEEEEEQEADEGSSDFALSDSEDGDRLASTSRARTMAGGQRQAAGSAPSGKPAGTGGGSALDKAKSFLSKYSVKATAKASTTARESESRTSRLEMSLDDLSLDSSGDEKKPVERRRAENVEAIARKEPPASAVKRTERRDSSSDESDSRSSGGHSRRQSIIEPSARTDGGKDNDGDSPLRHRELSASESDESEHAWPSSSRHDGGAALRSTKPVESDDDAVESISSRSADSVGEEHSDDRSGAARATEPADSGVYASDAFEEESRGEPLADAQQKPSSAESFSQQPRPTAVSMPQEESNFDYSMDFAEDEHAAVPTLAIPPVPDNASPRGDTRPSRSGSDDDHEAEEEERYSAFLDSEADDIGGDVISRDHESQDAYALATDHFDAESAPPSSSSPRFYIAAPGSFGSLNVRLV